jgi:hexosaminidase
MGAAQPQGLLWPLPRSVKAHAGSGTLDPSVFEFKATGERSPTLSSAFARYTKLLAPGAAGTAGAGAGTGAGALSGLDVDVKSDSLTLGIETSEAYNLTIAFPRATLAAETVYGALRGLETFSQLVGAGKTIAGQAIRDRPRFPHRGVMLDSSRHFLPVSAVTSLLSHRP